MVWNGHLPGAGRDGLVTIIEKLPELSIDKFSLHTLALRDQIKKLGIKIYTSTSAREITGTAVLADSPAGKLGASRRNSNLCGGTTTPA